MASVEKWTELIEATAARLASDAELKATPNIQRSPLWAWWWISSCKCSVGTSASSIMISGGTTRERVMGIEPTNILKIAAYGYGLAESGKLRWMNYAVNEAGEMTVIRPNNHGPNK